MPTRGAMRPLPGRASDVWSPQRLKRCKSLEQAFHFDIEGLWGGKDTFSVPRLMLFYFGTRQRRRHEKLLDWVDFDLTMIILRIVIENQHTLER